jgi:PTS system nitrogen regulatory IIA component
VNRIAALLNPKHILLNINVSDKYALFDQLATLLATDMGVNAHIIAKSLLEREQMGSTGLGHGLAVPHGRIKGIQVAHGALVRLNPPIDFDAPDDHPVNLLFFLFVPTRATDEHLQLLSEIAQMFGDTILRERLIKGNDSMEILALLQQWRVWSGS